MPRKNPLGGGFPRLGPFAKRFNADALRLRVLPCHLGFHVFVVEDACFTYDEALHRGSLAALTKNVALGVTTHEVLAAWAG